MVDGWRVARQEGDTARRSAYPEVIWASRAVAILRHRDAARRRQASRQAL
jgi:hypothetical protein